MAFQTEIGLTQRFHKTARMLCKFTWKKAQLLGIQDFSEFELS